MKKDIKIYLKTVWDLQGKNWIELENIPTVTILK